MPMNDPHLLAAHEIWRRRDVLADVVAASRLGEADTALLGDALSCLAEALAVEIPDLFTDFVAWGKGVLAGRAVSEGRLTADLEALAGVLLRELPDGLGELAGRYIDLALRALPLLPCDLPPVLIEDAPLADLGRRYVRTLLDGDRRAA